MTWYQDNTRKTYVATYKDEKSMRAEVEAAARFGFVTQAITRQRNEWTVTYHRDEYTWARIQVENALQQLSQERSKLEETKFRIERLQSGLQSRFRAARNETSNPSQLEQQLLKSISDLVSARHAANEQRQTLLNAYILLRMRRTEAAKLHVDVPQANINIEAESALLSKEIDAEILLLQPEETLQTSQQQVLKAVQEWQKTVGNKWRTHAKVSKTEKQVTAVRTIPATADTKAANTAASKTRSAEIKLAKHQTNLGAIESLWEQQEEYLLRQLETRDRDIAAVLG